MRFPWPGRRRFSEWVGVSVDGDEGCLVRLRRSRSGRPELVAVERATGDSPDVVLERLADGHGAAGASCVMTLEPGAYSLFQVDRPQVAEDEMHAALRWKVKDLIDFPLAEAVIDYFDVPPRSQGQRSGTVYVAVARVGALRPRTDAITESRLALDRIDIAELSLRNIAAGIAPDGDVIGLVHLGRQRGMVAIASRDTLYLARALSYGFDTVGTGAASDSGIGGGDDLADDAGTGEIAFADADPSFESIALEMQRTTDYYDSYFGQAPVRRLRIVPGLPSLQPLADHLSDNLSMDAELVPFESLIEASDDVEVADLSPAVLALGGVLTRVGTA